MIFLSIRSFHSLRVNTRPVLTKLIRSQQLSLMVPTASTRLVNNQMDRFDRQTRYFSSPKEIGSDVSSNSDSLAGAVSLKDKMKYMWKNYGYVAIGSYLGLYVITLGSIFLCLDFDVFRASTVGFSPEEAILKVCDIFETVTGSKALPGFIREHPTVGTFAVAWVMTKFTEPLRLGVTLAAVPKIAQFFGKGPKAAP